MEKEEYLISLEKYFIEHGLTEEEAKEECQRFRELPGDQLNHQFYWYWFDIWLAQRFEPEFVRWSVHRACHFSKSWIEESNEPSEKRVNETRLKLLDYWKTVGCVTCQRIFPSIEVKDFQNGTALCPYCQQKTLIPEKSRGGIKLTPELLKEMKDFWINSRFKVFP